LCSFFIDLQILYIGGPRDEKLFQFGHGRSGKKSGSFDLAVKNERRKKKKSSMPVGDNR